MNKVILHGRVGKDPEVKVWDDGGKTVSFTLATSYRYKKGEEWLDGTDWHNIQVTKGKANYAEKVVSKGSLLTLEGNLKTKKNEKDGKTTYYTFIQANDLYPSSTNERVSAEASSPVSDSSNDLPF